MKEILFTLFVLMFGLLGQSKECGVELGYCEQNFTTVTLLSQHGLTSDTDYEANERALMLIFVDMTKRGYRLPTAIQKNAIKNIAEMCPQKGGSVVYWARTWYRSLANDLHIPEDCEKRAADEREKSNELIAISDYAIYPNPANESLKVRLDNSLKAETEILIYDFTGKKVKSFKVPNGTIETQISLANLHNGLYRLAIICDAQLAYYESIVVMH